MCLCLHFHWHNVKLDGDVDANANVKCEHSISNKKLETRGKIPCQKSGVCPRQTRERREWEGRGCEKTGGGGGGRGRYNISTKNLDIGFYSIWPILILPASSSERRPCFGSWESLLYTGRLPSRFQMWTNVSWTWPTLANTAVNTNVSMWLEVTPASAEVDTGSTLISAPAEVSSLTSYIFEVSKAKRGSLKHAISNVFT